jgi:AraC-like DNA-binding protein
VTAHEQVHFRSLVGTPGIEILDAENSARNWRWFHTAFGLALMKTWHGEITYRRRQQSLEPGMILCTTPGEVHTAPRVHSPGTFQVIMFDAEVFRDCVAEHGKPRTRITWGKSADRPSPALVRRIAEVERASRSVTDAMEAQSIAVSLFEQIAKELVELPVSVRAREPGASTAERIREWLHSEEGMTLDLHRLAEKLGLSRFQVLRAFRTRYGLPPHAYQLCSRIAHARTMLRNGLTPTEVSAQCGFADQSHFGRHFNRLMGVTPAQYARACDRPRHSKLQRHGSRETLSHRGSRC